MTTPSSPPRPSQSFYRRPLPSQCIAFSSPKGKSLFQAALASDYAHAFFPLIEQFHTQNEPAYCGLGTLTMILNALSVDPGRVWKGPWRWFAEELLDCCVPLDKVKQSGITMREFACLARCNGARAQVWRDGYQFFAKNDVAVEGSAPLAGSIQDFRRHVRNSCRVSCQQTPGCEFGFIAVSYNRSVLGQTGTGHFSPIGAYYPGDPENGDPDRVLILDSARFKYPPHWATVEDLYNAMNTIDPDTGLKRGWVIVSRAPGAELQTSLFVKVSPSNTISEFSRRFQNLFKDASSLKDERDINGVLKQLLPLIHKHLDGSVHMSEESSELCEKLKACESLDKEQVDSDSARSSNSTQQSTKSCCSNARSQCCSMTEMQEESTSQSVLADSLSTFIQETKATQMYRTIKSLDLDTNPQQLILDTLLLLSIPFQTYGLLPQVSQEMGELRHFHNTVFLHNEVAKLRSQILTLLDCDNSQCNGNSDRCKNPSISAY